jgi:pantetheine-phosphate adenylyltransferase
MDNIFQPDPQHNNILIVKLTSIGLTLSKKYRTIALGGTFDYIHKGHRKLFSKAFELGENVLIGVTTDEFVIELGKIVDNGFKIRVEHLRDYLDESFDEKDFQIVPLKEFFGVQIFAYDVEAIVISPETLGRVEEFNKEREKMGFKELHTIVVEIVLANDGKKISSSRIRSGEIDQEGHVK